MTIHPLTVKGVKRLLKHDFNFSTSDDCENEQIICVVDRNESWFDPPIGYLVDIQLTEDNRVNLVIERNTECIEKSKH